MAPRTDARFIEELKAAGSGVWDPPICFHPLGAIRYIYPFISFRLKGYLLIDKTPGLC
jgi:hypothetical protein